MKKFVAIAGLLGALCGPGFAQLDFTPPGPNEDFTAWEDIYTRSELKALRSAYAELMRTRFHPLHPGDASRVFGPSLSSAQDWGGPADQQYWPEIDHHPVKLVLPMVGPKNMGVLSIQIVKPEFNHYHRDLHAIGDLGYVRLYYQVDGETMNNAVIYFRVDDRFVPLKSIDDFSKRLEWEKAKFDALNKWLDQHLPIVDLGVLQVSAYSTTRVVLADGSACLIEPRPTPSPTAPELHTIDVFKDMTNRAEKDRSRRTFSFNRPGMPFGFSLDGRLYRFIPTIVPSPENGGR